MNFIVTVFDDNPQTYIELDGYKYITHQYRAPIYLMPPFKQKFDTRHDIPGMIFSEAIQTVNELAEVGIECEPIRVDDYTGKKMTFFHDPDGLPLELHE